MPGPSVRSPVDEFRRHRRESRDADAPASDCVPGPGSETDPGIADPNQAAREKWRQETVEALRQLPPVSRLDQD